MLKLLILFEWILLIIYRIIIEVLHFVVVIEKYPFHYIAYMSCGVRKFYFAHSM